MARLSEACLHHLVQALATKDPHEKDFHIRQVLQGCGVEELSPELEAHGLGQRATGEE